MKKLQPVSGEVFSDKSNAVDVIIRPLTGSPLEKAIQVCQQGIAFNKYAMRHLEKLLDELDDLV